MFICAAMGASIMNLETIVSQSDKDKLSITPLGSDIHASEYLISIAEQVPLHIHKYHTKIIYVIDGEGDMTINDKVKKVKKGDYIRVPENTIHGVKVTSLKPLKVLSVQTPEYKGQDKHLVE
jgi:mannose-6-phosphate isomerase-like protein (cupin superfamily)